jgi:EF-hand domain pair
VSVAVFDLYDLDHDGTVSIVEVRSLYRGLMSLVTGLLRGLVDSFHTQRDSIWEIVEELFSFCDKDGDASLTAEEFTTFFDEQVIKTVEHILAKHNHTATTDMLADFLGTSERGLFCISSCFLVGLRQVWWWWLCVGFFFFFFRGGLRACVYVRAFVLCLEDVS